MELQGENGNMKVLSGAEAVKHALKMAQETPKGNLKLDDVKLPSVFAWLLDSEAEAAALSKLRQLAVENERKTATGALKTVARAAAKASQSSKGSSSNNSKKRGVVVSAESSKRQKTNPEIAMAMDMFS